MAVGRTRRGYVPGFLGQHDVGAVRKCGVRAGQGDGGKRVVGRIGACGAWAIPAEALSRSVACGSGAQEGAWRLVQAGGLHTL